MINWYLIGSCSFIGVIGFIAGYAEAAQKYRKKCDNEITARICELYRRDKIMSEKKYPIYHRGGCGKIGMYTTAEDPEVGDNLLASQFFRLNGEPFQQGDKTICDNCGKPMPICIDWIDYENPVDIKNKESNLIDVMNEEIDRMQKGKNHGS